MKTTYTKMPVKAKRFTAMFLALLMCFGTFNSGFYADMASSLFGANEQSFDMSVFAAEGDVTFEAGQTYYDSGSMWLQAYYSLGDGTVVQNDDTSVKTNGKYVYDESHYHQADGWLTLEVTSNLQEANAVTVPATTNINDIDSNNIMSCWREYVGSEVDEIYGVNVTDFGTPAASGQEFSYIARGTTVDIGDTDGDGLKETRIDWQIRSWPASKGDAPMSVDDISSEWTKINADMTADKSNTATTYQSDFYGVYAPKWESGNTWHDDWLKADGVSVSYTDWDKENGASYNNKCTRVINGLTSANIWTAVENGKNLQYLYNNDSPWLRINIVNNYAASNVDANNFKFFADVEGSKMDVYMPVIKESGNTYQIPGASVGSYDIVGDNAVDGDYMHWNLAADHLEKGTSTLDGVTFGPAGNNNLYVNFVPNVAGVITTLWPMTRDSILTPYYTDKNNGTEPTAYRLYGFTIKEFSSPADSSSTILDMESVAGNPYFLAYRDANSSATVNEFSAAASAANSNTDSAERTAARETFAEYAASSVTQTNVGLVYDVTYDQQRAGGDISGVIEENESSYTISTVLTDVTSGTHYAEATTDVKLNEVVSYTISGAAGLGKSYKVDAKLYEVNFDGTTYTLASATPIATAQSNATVIDTATGNITVQYTIDASALDGKTVVSYATLSLLDGNGQVQKVVATHENPADTAEQVTFTKTYIETDIISTATNTRVVPFAESTTVKDTVVATGLVPGDDYYVMGKLVYEAQDGSIATVPVTSGDSENRIKSAVVTADADGKAVFEVSYTFDSRNYAGKYVVAYANLYNTNDDLIFVHENFKDERQTAYIPVIETDASDNLTASKQGVLGNDVVIDTVTYTNLVPGVAYTLNGTIYVIDGESLTEVDTASTTFTPNDYNGTASVRFEYDASAYAGKTFVVYEELCVGNTVVAFHKDKTDGRQMVYYPAVATSAIDKASGSKTGVPTTNSTVVDTVSYQNLIVGQTYVIEGTLMTKSGGTPIAVENASGQPITATSGEFMTASVNGTATVEFTFDATLNNYASVVVYEKLYHVANDGTKTLIATHEDIDDTAQTVYYNSSIVIDTVALDKTSGSHQSKAAANTVITDDITITGLTTGTTYTLTGKLVAGNGQDITDKAGKPITATMTFTADSTSTTKTLVYDYDYSNMRGKVVATVVLSSGGVTVATHDNLADEDQTIYFPEIDTVATSKVSGGKLLDPIAEEVIVDKVSYNGLVGNHKYKLVGKLYDKTTGAFVRANDADVSVTVEFTATASGSGSVDVEFKDVNYVALAGHDIVVYQYLYDNANASSPTLIVEAIDVNDADETVHVNNPSVATVLAETSTSKKTIGANDSVKLTDTITYEGLIAGNTYVAVSKLVDKSTGNVLKDDDGKDLVVENAITGKTATTIAANFSFKGKTLMGKTVVAYNYLYRVIDGKRYLVVSEEDLTNTKQTVTFPSIDTVATDKTTGKKTVISSNTAVINDRVDYTGLTIGEEYTLTLTVYDKETNQPLAGCAPVVHKFRPATANGSETVSVTVNSTVLQGKTLVMFETLTQGDRTLCVHADINDADQTVYVGSIDTLLTAGNGGAKTVNLGPNVTVTDKITYTGLTPGQTYVIKGQIIDKETRLGTTPDATTPDDEDELDIGGGGGAPVEQPTTDIVAERTVEFTPTSANGTVSVTYTLNTTNLHGHHLVAFETVTEKVTGSLIMEHKDLNDADQTVLVKTTTTVDTGVENFTSVFALISVICLLGFAIFTFFTVKRRKNMVD